MTRRHRNRFAPALFPDSERSVFASLLTGNDPSEQENSFSLQRWQFRIGDMQATMSLSLCSLALLLSPVPLLVLFCHGRINSRCLQCDFSNDVSR